VYTYSIWLEPYRNRIIPYYGRIYICTVPLSCNNCLYGYGVRAIRIPSVCHTCTAVYRIRYGVQPYCIVWAFIYCHHLSVIVVVVVRRRGGCRI